MTTVVHLTSSRFRGGPENQMLGVVQSLPPGFRSVFVSFPEGGTCRALLDAARDLGYPAVALEHDTPRLLEATFELARLVRDIRADVLCTHNYKANLIGLVVARRAKIPIVAVTHGWTGQSWLVHCYEALDRLVLRGMDRVVCVSRAQAIKVQKAGVSPGRIVVIPCAIQAERFEAPDRITECGCAGSSPDHQVGSSAPRGG